MGLNKDCKEWNSKVHYLQSQTLSRAVAELESFKTYRNIDIHTLFSLKGAYTRSTFYKHSTNNLKT